MIRPEFPRPESIAQFASAEQALFLSSRDGSTPSPNLASCGDLESTNLPLADKIDAAFAHITHAAFSPTLTSRDFDSAGSNSLDEATAWLRPISASLAKPKPFEAQGMTRGAQQNVQALLQSKGARLPSFESGNWDSAMDLLSEDLQRRYLGACQDHTGSEWDQVVHFVKNQCALMPCFQARGKVEHRDQVARQVVCLLLKCIPWQYCEARKDPELLKAYCELIDSYTIHFQSTSLKLKAETEASRASPEYEVFLRAHSLLKHLVLLTNTSAQQLPKDVASTSAILIELCTSWLHAPDELVILRKCQSTLHLIKAAMFWKSTRESASSDTHQDSA